ncbi:MAG: arginine repressor [Eubacterium sp.]|nr:arginine repressor [Eubacterium sp.]SEF52189.1 transcriptional regulator, ArgR family [Eubacterium ruminantium]
MKNDRQDAILEIIGRKDIETQEELKTELESLGFSVTQATVSRDIRELGLKKEQGKNRKLRYTAAKDKSLMGSDSYKSVLKAGIISMVPAGNLIVVKTVSGVAMAVAAALDRMEIDELIGCIAGDDTIFLAVKEHSYTEKVISEIKNRSND